MQKNIFFQDLKLFHSMMTHAFNTCYTNVECVHAIDSVGSVSASRTVGREFASPPGHAKDHHKNGTNCLPA